MPLFRKKKKNAVKQNPNWKEDLWNKGPAFSKTFPKKDVIFKRVKKPKGAVLLNVTKVKGKGVAVSYLKLRPPSPPKKMRTKKKTTKRKMKRTTRKRKK